MTTILLLAELFARFSMVGLFSIGGGLATLPFLIDMGAATGWFNNADISNMVAISESTPGPLGVNMATYIGYHVFGDTHPILGLIGGFTASMGVIFPSIVVILIICRFLTKFRDSKYVNYAFYGLRAASVGLIAAACLAVAKLALFRTELFAQTGNWLDFFNFKSIALFLAVFFCVMKFKKIHPLVYIFAAAIIGVIFQMV